MNRSNLTFPKNERLSRKRHIDMLFQQGSSFVAHPLRVIYLPISPEGTPVVDGLSLAPVSMFVSVPKKKIKHAVDRNYIKRRIRESYRLRKADLFQSYAGKNKLLQLAIIYLSQEKVTFAKIDRAMEKVICALMKNN